MQIGDWSKTHIKSCFSEFVTGITVVTTVSQNGSMHGITVNSFNSVSLVPPMVLFSIEKSASRFEIFHTCSKFIVNILSDKQKSISQNFAECDVQNWEDFSYSVLDGIPIINGIMSYIYCAKKYVYDGGDHKIIVGEVINCAKLNNDDKPLAYYKGKYMVIGGVL
ncbi:flavin reductase like domain protein [Ehrlichia chaffeensis str. Heartland]|uniref:Flavin reductase n=1 Tax=Ehrlichia chaffeensis (strain ATCC CRL-10679 / Arkansas) TaxID=205920 RepID=Q2GH23_EHRCR|nr:flavin reductase family protein [Ehrlichia chaffeensis]ABD45058.1 putative flavin reductase [Ehrlichia chaffeensis str. Arkansas]AHX03541.1 flavin reductase like domain protein [Ehrlichia chaffeensis str. Heartland]AHX05738.1 flavin reductase like domain protein [Ehrlichia chaffeensis str. Jax]AHX06730.1 flavin reductase like domain protein [Ehrlichia chaffeensis str. Liberty]AHX07441.1 flavin reductase like domain protein [Ehrlichia chaffeensis str. Osceola]